MNYYIMQIEIVVQFLNTDLGTPIETFIVHMLLLKNPQFLPNDYETQSKLSTHE